MFKNMSKKKKIILTSILVLISAGVLSAGVYYTWLITPPSPPKTVQQGLQTINSAKFKHMPEYRQQAYLEQTQNLLDKMPENQRMEMFQKSFSDPSMRNAMMEIHRNEMEQRVIKFAKANPEERIKILDEMIDEMQARRKQFEAMRANGNNQGQGGPRMGDGPGGRGGPGMGGPGGGRGGRGPGRFADFIKNMAQTGNPQRAALMHEFHQAMRARMAQRGISMPGPRH
jgi:hypothetical protein